MRQDIISAPVCDQQPLWLNMDSALPSWHFFISFPYPTASQLLLPQVPGASWPLLTVLSLSMTPCSLMVHWPALRWLFGSDLPIPDPFNWVAVDGKKARSRLTKVKVLCSFLEVGNGTDSSGHGVYSLSSLNSIFTTN